MMNKYFSNILMLVVLLLAGTALTSCTHSDDPIPEPEPSGPKTYTLTIKASKSPDTALTRALSEEDGTTEGSKKIVSKWTADDVVSVYKDETLLGTLTAANVSADGNSCDLVGSLTTAPSVGNSLTLKYLSPSYNTQDGTLTGTEHSIDKTCDYSTASVTVKSVESVDATHYNITVNESSATFTNQQAIVQFVLLDKSDGTGNTLISPSSLTIAYGTESLSLSNIPAATYTGEEYSNGNGILYIAIPGFSDKDLKLTANVGTTVYVFEKSGVTFTNGDYKRYRVKTSFDPFATPLTFEYCGSDPTLSSVLVTNFANLEYISDEMTEWDNYSNYDNASGQFRFTATISKISFRGTNSTNTGTSDNFMQIFCSDDCYVYGNIMSLLDPTNFATKTNLPTYENGGVFEKLFAKEDYDAENYNKIKHKNGYDLVLPATELAADCYKMMFYGCMGLNHIRCLATNTLASNCTYNWVTGVAASGTFVVNSSLTISGSGSSLKVTDGATPPNTIWNRCDDYNDSGIPVGWTVTK